MIKLNVNGQEMTIDEARELYDELHKLFGETPQIPYIPQQPLWEIPRYQPIYTSPSIIPPHIVCGNSVQ